ncbi:MAG TPA: peptidylprolyl isomerase [Gemmatimonadales bacterium]|nr:peptidylprolyl isomerase [Gemmatimonadales bacterium]
MRPGLPLGIVLLALWAGPLSSQGSGPILEEILRAEDHRAATPLELRALLSRLTSRDTLVLQRAIRAAGRLQRAELAERFFPLLTHPSAGVRAEAVQAIAQAAQGLRPRLLARTPASWEAILGALNARVASEHAPAVRGMLALSLGRLPYVSPREIARAGQGLLALGEEAAGETRVRVARGMETLARLSPRESLAEDFLARLRLWARESGAEPRVRRAALGGLLAAQAADTSALAAALASEDAQLRRLAVTGLQVATGAARPREDTQRLLLRALEDSAAMVRYEALRAWSRLAGPEACGLLREATRDSVAMLSLLALDLLGTSCAGDTAAARFLEDANAESRGWQAAAHALLSLASVAPSRAAVQVPRAASSPVWQLRMYAARAAGVLHDTTMLRRLAGDPQANVRDAALSALSTLVAHGGDSLYRDALGAQDYQLVLSAAKALAGSPDRARSSEALLRALERITRERKETSRDPRVAILVRLRELGEPQLSPRLLSYRHDFDPAVAESAAALLTAWTGRSQRAASRPLAPLPVSLKEIEGLRGKRFRFTLVSGRGFEVALLVDEAPLTVLRVARLVARGYYDGLSFHRVVPNFVIQGGSPGANEYAGAARFMRDELGPLSHERGTLGISTRGRDTGDAQLFVNLCDNPRLDYQYTVWGRIVSGQPVVDGILEGEVIRRAEIRSR